MAIFKQFSIPCIKRNCFPVLVGFLISSNSTILLVKLNRIDFQRMCITYYYISGLILLDFPEGNLMHLSLYLSHRLPSTVRQCSCFNGFLLTLSFFFLFIHFQTTKMLYTGKNNKNNAHINAFVLNGVKLNGMFSFGNIFLTNQYPWLPWNIACGQKAKQEKSIFISHFQNISSISLFLQSDNDCLKNSSNG